MLKSTLDHLNSIRESDASWCTAAVTDILNLETEHGITIKGSRGPTNTSFVSSRVSSTSGIPYLDTLIPNINSHFSGKEVKLVVSASVFNQALLPDDETLLRAYGNSKLSTLAVNLGKLLWRKNRDNV